jgi:hypothetical protein
VSGVPGREPTAIHRRVERLGFAPLHPVAAALGGRPGWAVAGGWALDAWRGRPRRLHDDVDLAIDQGEAVALLDALSAAGAAIAWRLPGRDAGTRHDPHALGGGVPDGAFQAQGHLAGSRLDVVLEPWSAGAWRYRRDPAVVLPIERAVATRSLDGVDVPVLAPAPVLLLKATAGERRAPRPKDDEDLRDMLPTMRAEDLAWLRDALGRTAPEHPWLAAGGALG